MGRSFLLFLVLTSPCLAPVAQAGPLLGTLFEIGTRKPLYRIEIREQKGDPQGRLVQADYRNLAGKIVMQEEALYSEGKLQEYSLRQLQTGEFARVVFFEGKAHFLMRQGNKESAASEDLTPETLINDQLEGLVDRRWKELSAGQTVPIRFVVALRKETVAFELVKIEESEWKTKARKTLVLAMRPRSLIIRMFLDPIRLTFDQATHRLLGVQGRTTLRPDTDPSAAEIDATLEFDR